MQSSPFRGRLPLPEVPLPKDTVCYDVELPNEPRILEAFEGMVRMLGAWTYWERDSAHRAAIAAKVFLELYDRLEAHKCTPIQSSAAGADGDDLMIRQNPSNPCLLETSINGTDWCAFADLSKCLTPSGQPGSGSGMPPTGGGTQCYEARFQGSGKWLLPWQVSAGDTVSISGVSGAATDGAGIWYCANGQTFFLNACAGAITTSGGDPLNSVGHMRLIAKIAGTYYDAYNAVITVPGGVSQANVEFQLNDSNLADNFGEITFKACVQNNSPATWTHTFDFALSDGGWVPYNTGQAIYASTLYWDSQDFTSSGFLRRICQIKRTFASRTITQITMEFWRVASGTQNAGVDGVYILAGSAVNEIKMPSVPDGDHQFVTLNMAQAVTEIDVDVQSSHGSAGGIARIRKITVSGLGTDPF